MIHFRTSVSITHLFSHLALTSEQQVFDHEYKPSEMYQGKI